MHTSALLISCGGTNRRPAQMLVQSRCRHIRIPDLSGCLKENSERWQQIRRRPAIRESSARALSPCSSFTHDVGFLGSSITGALADLAGAALVACFCPNRDKRRGDAWWVCRRHQLLPRRASEGEAAAHRRHRATCNRPIHCTGGGLHPGVTASSRAAASTTGAASRGDRHLELLQQARARSGCSSVVMGQISIRATAVRPPHARPNRLRGRTPLQGGPIGLATGSLDAA
jgi:hypothetical protein